MEKWVEMKIEAKRTIRRICPNIPSAPGIYIFYRFGEDGLKYAYVGQAVNLLDRCASHLRGVESHIDRSIKTHGFHKDGEEFGYELTFYACSKAELNAREHAEIVYWGNNGYQLRNKTSGGQDDSKKQINEYRPAKGYYDGLRQGWKKARVFVGKLFDKNLVAMMNGKEGKRKAAALDKFNAFLAGEYDKKDDDENGGE